MKKNNLHLLGILLTGLFFIPVCLVGSQLPSGNNDRVFARWEWRDATLQSVISHIAAVSGVDIVINSRDSRIASENVTLSLRNRTWQEVLEIICHTKGLSYRVIDNYIFIADESDLTNKLIREAQTARNLEALEDLVQFTVKLKNTTAEQMMQPIQGILSPRGRIVPVRHTNSIIVHELARNVESVKSFIDEMDQEMLQISISAKIVQISAGAQQGMGVQWSFFDNRNSISHTPGGVGGALNATFGVLDQQAFTMTMDFLSQDNNSEVIAEPQITTLENRQARIFMGSQIPILRQDQAGNTVEDMVDASTELIVTATVTGQGDIMLDLRPTKRSYDITDRGVILHEQGAQTNVVVKDGETIVIAGLTSDDLQESRTGIPFLQNIPILGHLFKRQAKSTERRDLVIFVTPHIIKRTKLDLVAEGEAEVATTVTIDIQPEPRSDW